MRDEEEAMINAALRLIDGLNDMLAGGRLSAADIPYDFEWLQVQLSHMAELAQRIDLED